VSTEQPKRRSRPGPQQSGNGSGPQSDAELDPQPEPEPGPAPDHRPDSGTAEPATEPPAFRKLADPKVMRALAHPTRVRLLYEVGLRGTLTATQAAEVVGGTPAAAAYHLRTLGRYGFIKEAEGGTGRERPWKIAEVGLTWDDNSPDPAEQAGARLLSDVVYELWAGNIERYHHRSGAYPEDVREVSGASEYILFATVEEMREFRQQLLALLKPFQDRITDPAQRPPGHLPFEIVSFTHPLSDPPGPAE
jgi:DNA-binding transcriptional ArsR family regulator